jgi:hypothetical protein
LFFVSRLAGSHCCALARTLNVNGQVHHDKTRPKR